MLQLISGGKGTGKTKRIVEMAQESSAKTDGKVVFIEKGAHLTFDLPHEVRLFNTDDYEICGPGSFYGFLAGIAASDYDVKHIYVDSVVKIVGTDEAAITTFIQKVDRLAKRKEIEIVMALSHDAKDFSALINQYIVVNMDQNA
ncbi:MAG TPA: hypothetical protein DEP42_05195 [Ruminococcaceae bacterium]|nr:hypothetical protein [Oscillospiraceae bacterium]